MSDDVATPTAESQPASTSESQTATPAAEPTLEDVYKTYSVEDTARSFQAQPAPQQQAPQYQHQYQQPQVPELPIPDPTLDPAGYKQYETRKAMEQQASLQALRVLNGKLDAISQAAMRQKEEADIKGAVDTVNKHLGDKKLDPDLVEIALANEARKDTRFMQLWQNREKNPTAFAQGMKAFAGKLGRKFDLRTDPQLAENQRALKEATSSTRAATAPEPSGDEKLAKLQGAEFRTAMARIRQGLSP